MVNKPRNNGNLLIDNFKSNQKETLGHKPCLTFMFNFFPVYPHYNFSAIINNYHFKCHKNVVTAWHVNGVLLENNYDAALILTLVQLHTIY